MNDMFLLYLLTRLDSINFVCAIVVIIFLLVGVTLTITAPWGQEGTVVRQYIVKYLYIPIIATLVLVFVPTKQDAIFILAGSNIMEVAKSDDTKRIAGKSVQIFEKYLDELMKEKDSENAK